MAVRAGADLVFGSGPHVLRGMEIYRDRLIAYSLGNFSGFHNFDTEGVLGASAVLHVTVDKDGAFRSGRIASVRLVEAGQPVLDSRRRRRPDRRALARGSRQGRRADQRRWPASSARAAAATSLAPVRTPLVTRHQADPRGPPPGLVGARAGARRIAAGARRSPRRPAEPTPPRPQLHRCDLGMPNPFRCGHIMVPALRGDPALGKTKVAFAVRHRRDLASPASARSSRWTAAPATRRPPSPTPPR